MIGALPLFHRIEGRKILLLGEGDAAEPKRRLIERAGGVVETDMQCAMDEGVQLAFIAHDDADLCTHDAEVLKRNGMLVNVVDRPDLCDFTTPSILDRDPVLIAVGTGGASAGLAKHLRLRLERMLPQSLGDLAKALFDARGKLREKFPYARDRRRALDEALREGGPLDPFVEGSHLSLDQWLGEKGTSTRGRQVAFSIESDDPEDMTLKQARWLGEADTILLDGDIPEAILARARADAHRLPYNDQAYSNQEKEAALTGLTVILRRKGPG